jgi:hypothetical protein
MAAALAEGVLTLDISITTTSGILRSPPLHCKSLRYVNVLRDVSGQQFAINCITAV